MLNKINTSEGIRSFVANFAKQNGEQSDYRFDSSETVILTSSEGIFEKVK